MATSRSFSKSVVSWLKLVGPGIITAALIFGPSKMTITSKLGAQYGYSPLWIVIVAVFFLGVYTSMATRIGEAAENSLLDTIRSKWGKAAALVVGIGVFLVTVSFQAGNAIGVGVSLGELFHTDTTTWVILFNVVSIALLFFRSFYSVLEKTMMALIILMLGSFVVTFFMVKPDLGQTVKGFVTPTIPEGSQGLLIAFVASAFSIVGALYQAYLIREHKRLNPEMKPTGNKSLIGIVLLGVMSAVVIICAAAVLNPKGIKVSSASDMARALEPVFGSGASTLFLIGLFGAAFSSLIGNASVGGTLLSDALGYGSKFNSTPVRYATALVMIIGAAVALRFGKLPLELIVFAQSVTIFIVPFIGTAIYLIANDKQIMKERANGPFLKIFGGIGLLLVFALAIINVDELFFNNPLFK